MYLFYKSCFIFVIVIGQFIKPQILETLACTYAYLQKRNIFKKGFVFPNFLFFLSITIIHHLVFLSSSLYNLLMATNWDVVKKKIFWVKCFQQSKCLFPRYSAFKLPTIPLFLFFNIYPFPSKTGHRVPHTVLQSPLCSKVRASPYYLNWIQYF